MAIKQYSKSQLEVLKYANSPAKVRENYHYIIDAINCLEQGMTAKDKSGKLRELQDIDDNTTAAFNLMMNTKARIVEWDKVLTHMDGESLIPSSRKEKCY